MNRLTRMFRDPRAGLAVIGLGLGLAGCNQLEKLDPADTDGESGMPLAVRQAFEASCGKSGCHVSGGTAPTLVGGALDELVGTKYVTIGDIPNSYIAVKMLPDPTLEALGLKRESGLRMPLDQDFLNQNNQTILAWIAGAEFPNEGGSTDTVTDGDMTGGSGESGGEPLEPTFANVQAIFTNSCSCHLAEAGVGGLSLFMANAHANIVNKASVGLPAMNLITPMDPTKSYLYLKIAGGFKEAGGIGGPMPDGPALTPEAVLLIEEWIIAGAPND
ncbi:MAG: hypothetical protein H0T76_10825 [Nannocystis sp.]|nr:hypothetical protein [Nannocystis sp.]MBA3546966.1 hypothetical protein [Nannocystis sp.]